MAELVAHFTNANVPLVSPGTAPTINVWRIDTGALVVTDANMAEIGGGNFNFMFAPVSNLEYAIRADGDPLAAGQVSVGERYVFGSLSGSIQDAFDNLDVPVSTRSTQAQILSDASPFQGADIAAILADTSTTLPASIAALPTAAQNADATWDEARAGHSGAGSYGEFTGDAAMRGTDGANTVTPLAAATDQAEHDQTQSDIAALNDLSADGVWNESTATHEGAGTFGKAVTRLHEELNRTKLFFATAAISTGGRDVPINAMSHMEVQIRDDGGSFPGTNYFVVFGYEPGDSATDQPRSSNTAAVAPTDGTFTSTPYPT